MQRRLSVPGVSYARRCATTGAGACCVDGFLWGDMGCGCSFSKQPLVQAEPGFIIMCQSTEAFGSIPCPVFARAVRT